MKEAHPWHTAPEYQLHLLSSATPPIPLSSSSPSPSISFHHRAISLKSSPLRSSQSQKDLAFRVICNPFHRAQTTRLPQSSSGRRSHGKILESYADPELRPDVSSEMDPAEEKLERKRRLAREAHIDMERERSEKLKSRPQMRTGGCRT